MATITELYEAAKKLNMRKQVPILIEQTSGELIALNQRQLYNDSIDSKSEPLRLYRNLSYALDKNQMNPNPGFGRPDLYLTGAFFRGFNVRVKPPFYIISSNDFKTAKLSRQYGEDIFGLTDQSNEEYAQGVFGRAFENYITYITGLTFR